MCSIKNIYINNIDSTIIEGFGGDYNIIICNKNRLEDYGIQKFYLEFPSLNFYFKLINYTFSFNSIELFKESKDIIYFLICKQKNTVDNWIFGKIFMKKYQFIFNSEMKTMAFYIDNNIKSNQLKINYGIKKMIIIILLLLIIIILAMILNKYQKKVLENNKIYVNELEMINNYYFM